MGRKSLKVKGYSPDQIKALFNTEDKYKVGLRLYAVYQVSLGQSSRKLQELYNTSFKQITNWVHRFESEGLEGLRDKPGRGRKSALSGDQLARIGELLKESPQGHGYDTEVWTGPMLIGWIEEHFGVSFKKAQIYNIFKKLGYSRQRNNKNHSVADSVSLKTFGEALKKTSGKSF